MAEGDKFFLLEATAPMVFVGVVGVGETSDIVGVLAVNATLFEGADILASATLPPLGDLAVGVAGWMLCGLLRRALWALWHLGQST